MIFCILKTFCTLLYSALLFFNLKGFRSSFGGNSTSNQAIIEQLLAFDLAGIVHPFLEEGL